MILGAEEEEEVVVVEVDGEVVDKKRGEEEVWVLVECE